MCTHQSIFLSGKVQKASQTGLWGDFANLIYKSVSGYGWHNPFLLMGALLNLCCVLPQTVLDRKVQVSESQTQHSQMGNSHGDLRTQQSGSMFKYLPEALHYPGGDHILRLLVGIQVPSSIP